MTRSPWDKEYGLHNEYIWGTCPTGFAQEVVTYLPGRKARILDLGCGEGRDIVFFAIIMVGRFSIIRSLVFLVNKTVQHIVIARPKLSLKKAIGETDKLRQRPEISNDKNK